MTERSFIFALRVHGLGLTPWTGPGAWWRSPTGRWLPSLLVTTPTALLTVVVAWLHWSSMRMIRWLGS